MILLLRGQFAKFLEIGLALCLILGSPHSQLRIGYAANVNSSIKRIKIKYSVEVIINMNLNVGEMLLEIVSQLSVQLSWMFLLYKSNSKLH